MNEMTIHSIDTTMIGIPYGADGTVIPAQKFTQHWGLTPITGNEKTK